MKAKLTKIFEPRESHNPGDVYIRLQFMLEDGEFAQVDAVTRFSNFEQWGRLIKAGVGTWIDGVRLVRPKLIDGNSPITSTTPPPMKSWTPSAEDLAIIGEYAELKANFKPEFGNQVHIDFTDEYGKITKMEEDLAKKEAASKGADSLRKEIITKKKNALFLMKKANQKHENTDGVQGTT